MSRRPGGERRLPLTGIRIIDFGQAVAVPAATKYLAQYGAEVIKVESARKLDGSRTAWPMKGGRFGVNRSGYFTNHNNTKRSLALDLSFPEAVDIARDLVARADVVTENFSPQQMGRWGLDYPSLCRVKPDIIMVSASTQGRDGPHAGHPGFGMQLQAAGGINAITGWPDRLPLGPKEPYPDFLVAWLVLVGVIAGLEHRRQTGEGCHIDVSMLESCVHFIAPVLLDYMANGRTAGRAGNRVSWAAPHGVFPCLGDDRWVALAVETEEQWEAFRQAVAEPWTDDPRFQTLLGRKSHEDELERLVAGWTASQEADGVAQRLLDAGVPASIVARGPDLAADAHLAARGHFVTVDHPEIGPHPVDAPAFRLLGTPPVIGPAPVLGQDSRYVICTLLGRSEAEFHRLVEAGVIR